MEATRRRHVQVLLRWFKDGPPGVIPVVRQGGLCLAHLQAVTWEDLGNAAVIEELTGWHREASHLHPGERKLCPDTVRRWLTEHALQDAGRVLFWVKEAPAGRLRGHLGLSDFDYRHGTVVLGDLAGDGPAGLALVQAAVPALAAWVEESFNMRAIEPPARHHRLAA